MSDIMLKLSEIISSAFKKTIIFCRDRIICTIIYFLCQLVIPNEKSSYKTECHFSYTSQQSQCNDKICVNLQRQNKMRMDIWYTHEAKLERFGISYINLKEYFLYSA